MTSQVICEPVLAVLSAMEFEGTLGRITGAQLDRKLYVEVNKVLVALGGKWSKRLRGHEFPEDAAGLIEEAILFGSYDKQKTGVSAFDFFPTPRALAEAVCVSASLHIDHRILEPSAGNGALADVISEHTGGGFLIDCVELRPDLAAKLAAKGYSVNAGASSADFLAMTPERTYDRVVMNPPFSKRQDIAHIRHAHKFLRPGGRLVSIASSGVQYRMDRESVAFREFVVGYSGTISTNPAGSFKESGTQANTVTVIIPTGELSA